MTSSLEYHVGVRRPIPASVALFSLIVLPVLFATLLLTPAGFAQFNGASGPSYVGHSVNPPTGSVRPPTGAVAPPTNWNASGSGFASSRASVGSHDGHHHHHHYVGYAPGGVYAVPLPYAVDIGATEDEDDADADDSDANYQGGPTVFDRRGSGARSYVPPVDDASDGRESDPVAPDPPQVPTLLIFKDGHQLEVGNYAIVGPTLFDLTPGHARKVALSDLDLEATRKQNDDRGVIFQLPATPQAN
jgi:hypothetical protein